MHRKSTSGSRLAYEAVVVDLDGRIGRAVTNVADGSAGVGLGRAGQTN